MKRVIAAMRGRDTTNPNHRGKANANYRQRLEINRGGCCTELARCLKARYTEGVTNHKGSSSAVLEIYDEEILQSESLSDEDSG